jgi:hypothetical protein
MKTLLITALAITMAGLSLAQSAPQRFDVPFAFHVGNKQLPAGDYMVQGQANSGLIMVTAIGHGGGGAFAVGNLIENRKDLRPSKAILVFTKYGEGVYFLSQALCGNWTNGLQAPKSRAEREYVQSAAAGPVKPITVAVRALK